MESIDGSFAEIEPITVRLRQDLRCKHIIDRIALLRIEKYVGEQSDLHPHDRVHGRDDLPPFLDVNVPWLNVNIQHTRSRTCSSMST